MNNSFYEEQSPQILSEVLSRIIHELRTPLTLISCELQLMLAHDPALALNKELGDIKDNLDYMCGLLNDLGNYRNYMCLNISECSLSALLKSTADSFRIFANDSGIRFDVHIPESLPVVNIDQIKLRQALLNLLCNARESISHSRGRISLCAETVGDEIRITVSDNGCGIDPRELKSIFLPYVSGKSSGRGLGLAVTAQAVQAHGGRITVESTPGKGSIFHIHMKALNSNASVSPHTLSQK